MLFSASGGNRSRAEVSPRGWGGGIVAAPRVRFASCEVIKSNGLMKTLQHAAACAGVLFVAAGRSPNGIDADYKTRLFPSRSSSEIKALLAAFDSESDCFGRTCPSTP